MTFEEKMLLARIEQPWAIEHSLLTKRDNDKYIEQYLKEFTCEERYLCSHFSWLRERILKKKGYT